MAWFEFIWAPEVEAHIAEHGVTIDEFEEVVQFGEFRGTSRSTGRPTAEGWTTSGKYLYCVYELADDGITVIPVTAFEV